MQRRQLLSLAGLALLVILAGCSEAHSGIEPGIAAIESNGDGTYDIILDVRSTASIALHGVTIHGYSATGERVCSVEAGTVEPGGTTASATCAGVPSLLVPAVAEPCSRTPEDPSLLDDAGPFSHEAAVLLGYENGRYRTVHFEGRRCGASLGEERNRWDWFNLPPSERQLATVRCRQWRAGGNLSVLPEATWMDVPRGEPNVSVTYELTVVRNGSTSEDFNVHHQKTSLPERYLGAAPRATFERNLSARDEGNRSTRSRFRDSYRTNVTSERFYALHDGLSNRSIEGREDLRDVDGPHAEVGVKDVLFVNCEEDPERPTFDGIYYHETVYLAEYGGEQWYVVLRYQKTWSGPAIADGTALPAS